MVAALKALRFSGRFSSTMAAPEPSTASWTDGSSPRSGACSLSGRAIGSVMPLV
jgi:hypothetical protein